MPENRSRDLPAWRLRRPTPTSGTRLPGCGTVAGFFSNNVGAVWGYLVCRPVEVEGAGMMPALTDQERIFINKFTYRFGLANGDGLVMCVPGSVSYCSVGNSSCASPSSGSSSSISAASSRGKAEKPCGSAPQTDPRPSVPQGLAGRRSLRGQSAAGRLRWSHRSTAGRARRRPRSRTQPVEQHVERPLEMATPRISSISARVTGW